MSEKEINPLRRGRMQKQTREQNKKSTPGEISDPFTVLNDSIAAKNRSSKATDYIPSEKVDKTTTVDAVDPLSDVDQGIARIPRSGNSPRRPRNGNRENSLRENNSFQENNNRENGSQPPYNENYRSSNYGKELEKNSHPNEKSKCGVKCLLHKILSFLGLGSCCKKACNCRKNSSQERNSSQEDKEKRRRTNNRYPNSRGGRNHFRSSQNKFK
jgi:hypothetical protein